MALLRRDRTRKMPPVTMHDPVPAAAGTPASPPATRPLFRQEVFAFQQYNRQWGRVVPLQPLSTRIVMWAILAAAAVTIAFLCTAQYARKEVAVGWLAPAAGSARIFAAQPGTVSAVFVRQGDAVARNQPLLSIDTGQITATGQDVNQTILATLHQQEQSLTRDIAASVLRTDSERERMTAQVQEHETILGQLDGQMAVQKNRISIANQMVEAGALLRAKGLVSEQDQRHRQDVLLEQQQALITLTQQIAGRRGQLSEVRFNLAQLPFAQADKLQSLRSELAGTQQKIAEVSGRGAYVIRAPIAGRVALLQASVGAHADTRRVQMQIVPDNAPLRAELLIPGRAIGFVEAGQDVRLSFDSFPYQRFGSSHGRITEVSHAALMPADMEGTPVQLHEPAYTATVVLDRSDVVANGKHFPLQPDMSLRADIILERRTLANWILAPLKHLRFNG